MTREFVIDYHLFPDHRGRMLTQNCSNPAEIEFFLEHLIASRSRIVAIRENHRTLAGDELDKLIRAAAESVLAKILEDSLGVEAGDIRARFGFAAHSPEMQ